MALVKKTIDTQELEKVYLKKIKEHKTEYSYTRFVMYLGKIKSKGYFFTGESLHPKEQCLEFTHFLTKNKLYLHVREETRYYKQSPTLMLILDTLAPVKEAVTENTIQPTLDTNKILTDCGLFIGENELHKIYDIALTVKDTDSFMATLAMNHYVQKRVGRINHITDAETKSYWVGEFFDKVAKPEEGCYLYLVQIRTEMKRRSSSGQVLMENYTPVWYFMRCGKPVDRICLANGVSIELTKLEWLNYPFAEYYDLPKTGLKVCTKQKQSFELTDENLNIILDNLSKDGYLFRRERNYLALSEQCAFIEEQTKTIDAEIGIPAEYAKYGLNFIVMEFVNPFTKERKDLLVTPEEIRIDVDNAEESCTAMYTSWFRLDQLGSSLYYVDQDEENLTESPTEIVFPDPVFLPLLEKYHLICSDQILICRLMGNKENQSLFFDFDLPTYTICNEDEEQNPEIPEQEKQKAGRIRRIARSLRYELLEAPDDKRYSKLEMYVNKERNRAICLVERNGVYSAKYIDEFMDVREALRM